LNEREARKIFEILIEFLLLREDIREIKEIAKFAISLYTDSK